MSFNKILCSWMLATMVACIAVSAAAQEAFPNKPLRMIVPTAAGASNDVTARVIAEGLARELKQPVVVENRIGASGTIGADFVAKAPKDGYTLLLGTGSTHVVAPAMLKGVPYDPIQDFVPLSFVGAAPFVLFVRTSLPVKNLQELVALAKSKPGELSFGTTGPAAVYELGALTLEAQAGIKFNHVPYKGFAPMVLDVMGDRVDVGVGPIDNSIKSDRVRVIAVVGKERVDSLPGVPSAAEQGFPDFTIPAWAGIWTTAGTPQAVVDRLVVALRTVQASKEVKERIAKTGINPEGKDGNALRLLMAQELASILNMMTNAKIERQAL